jgi:hypothetical protein
MRCPGSVNFIESIEDDPAEGTHAAEGTILHSFCEDALRSGKDAYDFVGETREHDGFKLELDDELADMMQAGLEYIDGISGKLFIEHKVNLDRWMPGQFGTLDVGICGRKRITIFDWKWGMQPVSPIKNEQLQIYALGFWDNIARYHTDATNFRLVIWQPRAPGGGGEWDTTLDELLEFGRELKRKAKATYGKDAPRIPGPVQCRWCEGAKSLKCKEYADYNLSLIYEDFDELDRDVEDGLPPRLSTAITPERRGFILQHRPMFEKFLDRLQAQALDDALKGLPTPGQKAVEGRTPPRKWKDPEKAKERLERLLGEDAYTKKLKTPTQIEKELPKKFFDKLSELIERGQPKPVLVSIDDARPAIPPISDLFDD